MARRNEKVSIIGSPVGRNYRLCDFNEVLEHLLLIVRIHELHSRNMVLCLDQPARARASDSAAAVQVLDDIHKPGNRLDQHKWFGIKHSVAILKPGASYRVVATNDGIEGAIETYK